MARINVEETFWSDPRFLKLCAKLGNEALAIGSVVLAWKLAQKFWCPDKQPIPTKDWLEAELPEELVICCLADKTPEGIYMRGCEESFAWWFQKQAAGKKGGYNSAQRTTAGAERALTVRSPSLSSSSSLSSSFSSSESSSEESMSIEIDEHPTKHKPDPNILVKIWNTHRGVLPECKSCKPGTTRYRSAQSRLKEMPEQSYWENIVKRIAASSFCRGEKGDRGWRADFGFLIRQETHFKVDEGKYDDTGRVVPKAKNETLILKILEDEKRERAERELQRQGIAVGDQKTSSSGG